MTTQARIGFIGAGRHATGSLYPNLPLIPECDLVAVCDVDESRAQDIARRYGASAAYVGVEQMLDSVTLDGCCICGPPEMHYAIGIQLLQRGIPIFVEKPPAPSLVQATEMAQIAARHGTWGMVGFMKRFAPANLLAQEYMTSPAFGQLSSITVIHGAGPYDSLRQMLYMNGIHLVDLARFLGGEVAQLHTYGFIGDQRNPAVVASGVLANGALVQFNLNAGHSWNDCYEAVYASGAGAGLFIDASREVEVMNGGARFATGEGLHLFGFRARHTVSGNMAGWWAGAHYQRGYWGELSHFVRSCCGLEQPTATLDEGVRTLTVIETMLTGITRQQKGLTDE